MITLKRNDNNRIEIPVAYSNGTTIPASDIVLAKLTIFDAATHDVLFSASLGSGIDKLNGELVCVTDKIDFYKTAYLECRIRDVLNHESTILREAVEFEKTELSL